MTWTKQSSVSSSTGNSKYFLDGYNLVDGLRLFRNAVADIDNNPVKICVIGDSVTQGSYASDLATKNWVGRLRTALQNTLGNVGQGTYPVPSQFGDQYYPAWSWTGTWTHNYQNSGIGGRSMSGTGTCTASLTFTGTSLDLVYTTNTDGDASGAVVKIDGVTVVSPNFYSATKTYGNVQSYTGLSAGSHTLSITCSSSGTIYIETAIAYNPTASAPKGCYVYNFGSGFAQTSWFSPNISQITNVAKAHLYIVALGINDAINNNTANYQTNMSTIIQGCQNAGASVLLLPYYMINDSNATYNSNYISQITTQYSLCDTYNCALVDIYARWGKSWSTAQAAGMMGSGSFNGASGSDAYHPSDKGHRDIASAVVRHLIGGVA